MTDESLKRAVAALERIGKVLGAVFVSTLGDVEPSKKVRRLRECGFSNAEIAGIMGMTANAVGVALHRARRGREKKAAKNRKRSRRAKG